MKRWKTPHSHSGGPFAVEGAASEQPQLLPAVPQGKGPKRAAQQQVSPRGAGSPAPAAPARERPPASQQGLHVP